MCALPQAIVSQLWKAICGKDDSSSHPRMTSTDGHVTIDMYMNSSKRVN